MTTSGKGLVTVVFHFANGHRTVAGYEPRTILSALKEDIFQAGSQRDHGIQFVTTILPGWNEEDRWMLDLRKPVVLERNGRKYTNQPPAVIMVATLGDLLDMLSQPCGQPDCPNCSRLDEEEPFDQPKNLNVN